ncbi:MAG: LysR family transcriptional regulator [Shewanella algae]|uniref:LysR substrate-binding domain-containing protein n=1 Tax=Shewanella algae TaxID=38313 RepID=UPI00101EA13F
MPKPQISLAQIRAFCALAQQRSFKEAAEHLQVSQPSIINQIASLEEAYGAKLFLRQRENNRLTQLGVALLPSFRAILSQLKEAEFILLSHSISQTGELHIAAVNPVRLSAIVREFRLIYPNIKVNITFAASNKVLQLLETEAVDAGFFVLPQSQPGLQAFHYYRYKLMAILPRDHRLCRKDTLSIEDFANEELLIREPGSLTRKLFLGALQNAGIAPQLAYELGSRESVREAVAQGLGISVVAEDEHTPHEQIVTKRIVSDQLKASSSLVVHNKQLNSPMIKTLIALVAQHKDTQISV